MLTTHPVPTPAHAVWHRRPIVRWLPTFAAFPLGSVLARALAGPVDTTAAALLGGLVNGLVIGAAQGWALRPAGVRPSAWAIATGVGLMIGLAIGATVVDFGTATPALSVQGAVCGAAVGLAQALVLARRVGRLVTVWPLIVAASWTLGWAITATIGVDVAEQFTVFGSSGAVVVTALTAVLPLLLARRSAP
jgi:hypothetical protein